MAGQNYVARLILEAGSMQKGAQQAETTLQRVEQAAKKAEGANTKTTLAAQNVVRIVQDLPFGMMGITNNIQALGASLVYLRNQGMSFGTALTLTLRSVLTGPMSFALLTAVITNLIFKWDELTGMIDKARVLFGIISKDQADFNKKIKEYRKELEKIKSLEGVISPLDRIKDEKIPDSIALINTRISELTDQKKQLEAFRDQWDSLYDVVRRAAGLEKGADIPADIAARYAPTEESASALRNYNTRLQQLVAIDAQLIAHEAQLLELQGRKDKLTNEENVLSMVPKDWLKGGKEDIEKAKVTLEDFLKFQTDLMFEGRDKTIQIARDERRERLEQLREFYAAGLISEQTYQEARQQILRQYLSDFTQAFEIDGVQKMKSVQEIARKDQRERLVKHLTDQLKYYDWFYGIRARADQKEFDRQERVEQERRQQKLDTLRVYSQFAGSVGSTFGNLATVMAKEGERGLEENKKLLVAQATMQAISAGINVVAGLLSTPPVGPFKIATAIAAGASIVSGLMAQVRQIESVKAGGATNFSTGSFTALNPTVTANRVRNFENNRRRDRDITEAVRSVGEGMDRLAERISNIEVTYNDRTAEHLVSTGMKQMSKLNTTG